MYYIITMKVFNKLFYGTSLGMYRDVFPKLIELYGSEYSDNPITYSEWITYKFLPEGLYLNVSYNHIDGPFDEIEFHLDFLDNERCNISQLIELNMTSVDILCAYLIPSLVRDDDIHKSLFLYTRQMTY
jgi:hypothetical protein